MADGLWETDDLKCAVTAPTGLASFNVDHLPHILVAHRTHWALPKGVHKVLESELRSLSLTKSPWCPASTWLTFTSVWKSCLGARTGLETSTSSLWVIYCNSNWSMESPHLKRWTKSPLSTNSDAVQRQHLERLCGV